MLVKNKVTSIEENFTKGKLLGEGSFGKVYICKHAGAHSDGTEYALKELEKDAHNSGWAAHFLKNELVIMKSLSHPNCVSLVDIF
jgi:serine/threonine protein kinase